MSAEIETTRWDDVQWVCPSCSEDYDEEEAESPPPLVYPVDQRDTGIDTRLIWGVNDDNSEFDYQMWLAAKLTTQTVHCQNCDTTYDVDLQPRD